ncbi:YIP1 family protein [uncultured Shimia sp.]|uniref:YIP1 family protein n=1 Tax=uncultured Shimia sp. TaxID=573152 RepID=UPI00262ED041|nr:YIP1 family protein [uncultured Shimia sp.]
MSVIGDIVATYGGPRKVVARHLAMGQREDRVLVILMAACVMLFVASWPFNARRAHLEAIDMGPLMGGSLFALMFMAPLLFYVLSAIVGFVLARFGWKGGGYGSRFAMFWALLATSPVLLLHGLVRGFIGPGVQEQVVGLIWFVLFMWFWISGLWQAGRSAA